jgi:hypothetical protein
MHVCIVPLYVCMYACMYVCIVPLCGGNIDTSMSSICVYVRMCVCVYVRQASSQTLHHCQRPSVQERRSSEAHRLIYIYIYIYIYTHTYIHTYIHKHTHTDAWPRHRARPRCRQATYIHTRTHMHTCIHTDAWPRHRARPRCRQATYIHTHIHTYIHTHRCLAASSSAASLQTSVWSNYSSL